VLDSLKRTNERVGVRVLSADAVVSSNHYFGDILRHHGEAIPGSPCTGRSASGLVRSPPRHMRPHSLAEVRPGLEPCLPRLPGRRATATPPDHRVAEAGFEPAWARLRDGFKKVVGTVRLG